MTRNAIIVGVDFSEAARTALDYAALLASRSGAQLRLVHAWNPTGWAPELLSDDPSLDRLLKDARREAEDELQRWTESVTNRGVDAVALFEQGPASHVLPEVARRDRASMIVVGRHGHASLAHVFLGSVSERVVRVASCPVLVVPKLAGELRLPRRLMVGIDFSSASREALEAATRIGRELDCEGDLLLVHAYQDEREMWMASWSEARLAQNTTPDAQTLRRWVARELGKDVRYECSMISGYAERALPDAAEREGCDWIVLGVQGRTALASYLIGSTTQRILKLSERPVLAVPPQDAPSPEEAG